MLCYVLFLLLFLSEKKRLIDLKSQIWKIVWVHTQSCLRDFGETMVVVALSSDINMKVLPLGQRRLETGGLWFYYGFYLQKPALKKKIKNFWISVMCQWLLKTFVAKHIYLQVYIQVLSNSFGCCLNWNTTRWFFTSAVTTCEAAGKRKSNLPAWSQWRVLRHTVHKYRTYYLN